LTEISDGIGMVFQRFSTGHFYKSF
jgi:hypothetical protein